MILYTDSGKPYGVDFESPCSVLDDSFLLRGGLEFDEEGLHKPGGNGGGFSAEQERSSVRNQQGSSSFKDVSTTVSTTFSGFIEAYLAKITTEGKTANLTVIECNIRVDGEETEETFNSQERGI